MIFGGLRLQKTDMIDSLVVEAPEPLPESIMTELRAHLPSRWPCEVFLNGGKEGSQVDAMLADAATVTSVALQYGVPLTALAKSVSRAPNASTMPGSLDQLNAGSQPASPIGAALDLLMAHEPRPNGEPSTVT